MKKRVFLILILIFLAAEAVAAQKNYHNREFKFGFKYPVGSKLRTDEQSVYAFPPLKGVVQVSLNNPGKGVYDAAATISVANISQDECQALSTTDDKPQKKRFGTVTFDKTKEVEGGMESRHPVEFYRTFHNGVCFEIRLMIGMDKYPKRHVNERAAFERFYIILRTFEFR